MRTDPEPMPSAESRVAVWAGRLGISILIVALAHLLLTAGRLMLLAAPVADEMLLVGNVRNMGLGRYWADMYLHWTGRWSGVGVFLILGRCFEFRDSYGWLLVAVQFALPLAVYALLSATFRDRLARSTRALLSLGLLALHWAGDPSLCDSYNWLTGGIENHLSLSLGLFLLAGLIRVVDEQPRAWITASLAGLAVITTGMHQLYGVYFCFAVLIGTIACYMAGATGRRTWVIVAVTATIGLAVSVCSPGNAFRVAAERPGHRMWWFRELTWWWANAVFPRWVIDVRLWLATLVIVCHPRVAATVPNWLRERRMIGAAAAATLTMGFLLGAILANWWTFRMPLPGRTQSAVYLLFLVGWFATAYALVAGPAMQVPRPVWAGLAGCFGLALLSGGNYPVARTEFDSGLVAAFHQKVSDRDRIIRDAVAAGNVNPRVPLIAPVPSCFLFAEVVDESVRGPCWYNDAYRAYYGLNSIRPIDLSETKAVAAISGPR